MVSTRLQASDLPVVAGCRTGCQLRQLLGHLVKAGALGLVDEDEIVVRAQKIERRVDATLQVGPFGVIDVKAIVVVALAELAGAVKLCDRVLVQFEVLGLTAVAAERFRPPVHLDVVSVRRPTIRHGEILLHVTKLVE